MWSDTFVKMTMQGPTQAWIPVVSVQYSWLGSITQCWFISHYYGPNALEYVRTLLYFKCSLVFFLGQINRFFDKMAQQRHQEDFKGCQASHSFTYMHTNLYARSVHTEVSIESKWNRTLISYSNSSSKEVFVIRCGCADMIIDHSS